MNWKDIKTDAKDCIKGNRGKFWGYIILSTLSVCLISGLFSAVTIVIWSVLSKMKIVAYIVCGILGVFSTIVMLGMFGAQLVGLMANAMDMFDGMSPEVNRMFQYTKNIFSCAGLIWGYLWRCTIPILNIITFTLAFPAFCIKSEKTYMKGHFCWKEAGKMMNGYKMNFFLFILSNIPMLFISMLLFPVGIIWLPQFYQSIAVYYCYVKEAESGGYAAGMDLGIHTDATLENSNLGAYSIPDNGSEMPTNNTVYTMGGTSGNDSIELNSDPSMYEYDKQPNNDKPAKAKKEKPVKAKKERPAKEPKPKKEKPVKEKKGLRPGK